MHRTVVHVSGAKLSLWLKTRHFRSSKPRFTSGVGCIRRAGRCSNGPVEKLERALEQFGLSPDERVRFYKAVDAAVTKTIDEDMLILPSRSIVKERVDIVVGVFAEMMLQKPRPSFARITSELHPALRAKLDRRTWNPSGRQLYVPA